MSTCVRGPATEASSCARTADGISSFVSRPAAGERALRTGPPGAPGHGVRAGSGEPERSRRGADRAAPGRRLAHGRRDDPGSRRRDRDRGDDDARRRRVDSARPARAADDGGRGGRAGRGQRPRRLAPDRIDIDQPGQRGGRRPHRRLRGQHRYLGQGRRAARAAYSADAITLSVVTRGGLGGHSGVQIALGRSNAIKVLGRVLREAAAVVPFRLVSLDGGKSRNAIPRDAVAICSVPRDQEKAFRAAVGSATTVVEDAYAKTDPGVTTTVESAADASSAWTAEATSKLLDVVALVPTGPLAMSPAFDGLVETSTSLGEATTEDDTLILHSLSRSSNDAAMPEVIASLDALARLAGGALEVKFNYNGWRPDLDSPVLSVARAAYERLFSEPPVVSAIHAGLEHPSSAPRSAAASTCWRSAHRSRGRIRPTSVSASRRSSGSGSCSSRSSTTCPSRSESAELCVAGGHGLRSPRAWSS